MGKIIERKIRSDKKRDVKPTVHVDLYDCISRISYVTNTPMKDVAEDICTRGLSSPIIIEYLAPKFRRNYYFKKNHTLFGNPNLVADRAIKKTGDRRRITMRFSQPVHDKIAELAYSLDMTVSSATALLLEASLQNIRFLEEYIEAHVDTMFNEQRKEELKLVFRYLKKDNPFEADDFTFMEILGYFKHEFKSVGKSFKRSVETWLDKNLVDEED